MIILEPFNAMMKILLIHVCVLSDSQVLTARRILMTVTPILVKMVETVLTFCLVCLSVHVHRDILGTRVPQILPRVIRSLV